MKIKILLVFFTLFILVSATLAQGVNCDAMFEKGTPCYEACKRLYGGKRGDRSDYQGAYESIMVLDSLIVLCPDFADPYYTKAIPYLKRGEFITWKNIIDKAVERDTITYMGYRGGARFMFLRDYEGAIADIECLKTKVKWDIGYIYNGDYHLEVIRALSYRGIGQTEKAISILEDFIRNNAEETGRFAYFHLGVMYYQINEYDKAEAALIKQVTDFDYYADSYYYLAMIKSMQGDKDAFFNYMNKAKEYYLLGKCLPGLDSFMDYPDKIYLQQIEDALAD